MHVNAIWVPILRDHPNPLQGLRRCFTGSAQTPLTGSATEVSGWCKERSRFRFVQTAILSGANSLEPWCLSITYFFVFLKSSNTFQSANPLIIPAIFPLFQQMGPWFNSPKLVIWCYITMPNWRSLHCPGLDWSRKRFNNHNVPISLVVQNWKVLRHCSQTPFWSAYFVGWVSTCRKKCCGFIIPK